MVGSCLRQSLLPPASLIRSGRRSHGERQDGGGCSAFGGGQEGNRADHQSIEQMAHHQGGCLARIEMTAKQPPADQRREHRDQRNQPGGEERGKLRGHEVGQPIRQLYEELEATTRLLRRN
jgi:hypothetical protein